MKTSADQYDCPAIIAAGGPPAHAAWDEFIADENLRQSTRRNYRHQAARFLSGLESQGISLSQITPSMVQSFLDRLNGAHLKYLSRVPLRRLFDSLVRHCVLTTNPAARPQFAREEPVSENESAPSRACRRCRQQKSLDEFRISNRWESGRPKICRVCESAARRAGRARYLASAARTQLASAPHPQPRSPKDLCHKTFMFIVYGFKTEEKILAEHYGKDSPQYKAEMAPMWIAVEKLFALLRQAALFLGGETGPENPVTTAPNESPA